MNTILSSSNEEYTKYMAEILNVLDNYTVKGIAVVALTEETDTITAYWNMDLTDKQIAKEKIGDDCIDEFIRNNSDRYGFETDETAWDDNP